jgi:hypothetical protein
MIEIKVKMHAESLHGSNSMLLRGKVAIFRLECSCILVSTRLMHARCTFGN